MKKTALIFLLLLIYCSSLQAAQGHDSPQYKLYDHLLDGYRAVRPVRDWSHGVKITFTFYITQLLELSSVDQRLEVVAAMPMFWKDEFLQWNMTEYNISDILIPAKKIWTPDFAIYNSADGVFVNPKWKDYDVRVYADGRVMWGPGGHIATSCNIKIKYFPFDTQTCNIRITNWLEDARSVNFTLAGEKVDDSMYLENSEWILEKTSMVRFERSSELNGTSHVFSKIDAIFTFKRRSQSYATSLIIPMFVLSISGTLIFLLAPDSGEKISLGLTIMLGFSVFQLLLTDKLPQSSQETPLMMIIVTTLMVINGISIVMSVFVLHLHHKQTAPEMPNWLRKFAFNFLGTMVCKKRPVAKVAPAKVDSLETEDLEIYETFDAKKAPKAGFDDGLADLGLEILTELKKMNKRNESNDEEQAKLADWKEIASIMDRIFFFISVTSLIVIVALFFLLFP